MADDELLGLRDPVIRNLSARGSKQMQGLLSEFRGLYESRLRKLDEEEKVGKNTQKVKIFHQ